VQIRAVVERARRLPSFLTGSIKQTRASFEDRRRFPRPRSDEVVVLVPGAFCTAGVMNELAGQLNRLGLYVELPRPFPYYWGALANLCPLEEGTHKFLDEFHRLRAKRGIEKVWFAGHSNGGLLSLLAIDIAEEERDRTFLDQLQGVITMAAPFKGTDVASLMQHFIPVCRDLRADSPLLKRVARQRNWVKLCLQAEKDFLVPPENQYLEGMAYETMPGYQHMDFVVGGEAKVGATAEKIAACVRGEGA